MVRAVVLACYFFARHHCSGRPQRWASGLQRGLWLADNESRGKHPLYRHSHAGTSSDEPLEEEEDARREEAEQSAVAPDTPGRIDAWSAGNRSGHEIVQVSVCKSREFQCHGCVPISTS